MVSTAIGLPDISALRRMGVPASGVQTRMLISNSSSVKGMGLAKPATVPMMVPAHGTAVGILTTSTTLFPGLVGSSTTCEAAPQKSYVVWSTPGSSKVAGKSNVANPPLASTCSMSSK